MKFLIKLCYLSLIIVSFNIKAMSVNATVDNIGSGPMGSFLIGDTVSIGVDGIGFTNGISGGGFGGIKFNPSVLKLINPGVSINAGQFNLITVPDVDDVMGDTISDISFAAFLLPNQGIGGGQFDILTATFEAIGNGTSNIELIPDPINLPFADGGPNAITGISFNGTSVQIGVVPIPAAVWLFVSAVAGIGVVGRRK